MQVIFFSIILLSFSQFSCRRIHDEFPGKQWASISPEDAGFSSSQLDSFVEFIGGTGCIVRNGLMVKEWGFAGHPLDVASAVKPVYAHIVYMSIYNKRISSLDELVCNIDPRLSSLNPELNFKDHKMTWRHLVTQTACYGVSEDPGTAFDYSDFQTALLIDTLVFRVYETGYDGVDKKILNPLLADHIRCQDYPTMNGIHVHPGRLRISARDFVRFGMLYLKGGKWMGRQVVPSEFVHMALSSPHKQVLLRTQQKPAERILNQRSIGAGENQEEHLNSYTYMWWLNGIMDNGQRVLPDAPTNIVYSIGHAGRDALIILPDYDIVLCWMDGLEGMSARRFSQRGKNYVNLALKKLIKALPDS